MDRSTLRVAVRTLGRHRGFATVAILSISVAIALNTVMYSVMDAMLAPKVNARKPENIYALRYYGNGLWSRSVDPRVFEEALAGGLGPNGESYSGSTRYRMRVAGTPIVENGLRYKRVSPIAVRANYFEFLGALPLAGRTFRASDEQAITPCSSRSSRRDCLALRRCRLLFQHCARRASIR